MRVFNKNETLLEKDNGKKLADPEIFSRYLINEVNRYLNGEKVDIDLIQGSRFVADFDSALGGTGGTTTPAATVSTAGADQQV